MEKIVSKNKKKIKSEIKFLSERETRKLQNAYLSNILKSKEKRLNDCSRLIGITTIDDIVKQTLGSHCNVKLCPICARRKEMKMKAKIFQIMPHLKESNKYSFIYSVFTVRNCDIKDLKSTIFNINKAFNKLCKYKDLTSFKGFFRTLEITRNPETDQVHPHINVIFAVNKSYFTDKTYIKKSEWDELWKKALNVDYDVITYVKKIKLTEKDLLEILKYSIKTTDLESASYEWLNELDKQMKGIRIYASGGIFKNLLKQVTEQYESEELMPTEEENYKLKTENFFVFKRLKYRKFNVFRDVVNIKTGKISEVPMQMRKLKLKSGKSIIITERNIDNFLKSD